MYYSAVSGDFKTNLEVTLKVCFLDQSHDSLVLPGILDDLITHFRDGDNTCSNVLCQKGTALSVFAGDDVVLKCITVLGRVNDFFVCHFSFLHNNFFYFFDNDLVLGYRLADLLGLGCCLSQLVFSFLDLDGLRIELLEALFCGFNVLDLGYDLSATSFELFDLHFFNLFHRLFPPVN